jgi:ABC-type transporter Mla subunit MlaD
MRDAVGKILADLVEQRRQSSAAGEENGRLMHQAMTDLLDEVRKASAQTAERYGSDITAALGRVDAGVDAALAAMSSRQSQAEDRTDSLLASLGQRVEALIQSSEAANAAIRDAVDRLGRTTIDAIGGMNRGAETMRQAAEGFTTAGTTVTGAIARGGELFERVSAAAKGLEATALTMRDTVAAYNQTRGSLEAMAETLRKVSQEAEQKSGLNRTLLAEMEQLVKRFAETQAEARTYLEQVSEVLGTGFDAFQGAMESSLNKNRGEFDASLTTAVAMIRTELQELETVLADFRAGLRS